MDWFFKFIVRFCGNQNVADNKEMLAKIDGYLNQQREIKEKQEKKKLFKSDKKKFKNLFK